MALNEARVYELKIGETTHNLYMDMLAFSAIEQQHKGTIEHALDFFNGSVTNMSILIQHAISGYNIAQGLSKIDNKTACAIINDYCTYEDNSLISLTSELIKAGALWGLVPKAKAEQAEMMMG